MTNMQLFEKRRKIIEECQHPKDAIKWNPWCKMVLCHRCGEQFWRPITHYLNMKIFDKETKKIAKWLDSELPPEITL